MLQLFGPFFTLTLVHKTPIQGHQECPNQFGLTHQSCRAQKIKFIEGLTYKFLSKIKALQELQKNSPTSYKKYTSSFLVHHCRNLKSGICTISFLLRSLYMFITVYHSFPITPHFHFFKQPPRVGLRPTRGHGWPRPAMTTGGLEKTFRAIFEPFQCI